MNNDIFEIPEFKYPIFKDNLKNGDIWGLEYLEKTIIRDFKDRINDNIDKYTYYDYIINLYNATRCLNECIYIHENTSVENNFNWEIYANTRDKLFEELGFDLEDLYK